MTNLVQSVTFQPTLSSATTYALSGLSLPTIGNSVFILLTSAGYPGYISSIADNQATSNTYSTVVQTTSYAAAIAWCPSVVYSSGTYVPTITFTAAFTETTPNLSIQFMEVSGLAGTVDQTGSASGAATATTQTITNSGTNAGATDFVLAAISSGYAGGVTNTLTGPSNGFTSLFSASPTTAGIFRAAAYKIDTGAVTDSTVYSWPTTVGTSWCMASFQSTGAASTLTPIRRIRRQILTTYYPA